MSLSVNIIWIINAYLLTIIISRIAISHILVVLYREVGINRNPFPKTTCTIGAIENILYLTALLGKAPEFIAVWLAIKTASSWASRKEQWAMQISKNATPRRKKWALDQASGMWSVSLIGNALNLLITIVVWLFLVIIKAHGIFPEF